MVAVDRAAKTVTVGGGEVLAYDKLVFATGSYPFVPPLPGKDRKDCFVYRTIEDLEAMLECGQRSKTGVVIGGGLLGLECAKALRDLGLETHVVEFAPRLMAVQVDDGGARVLRKKIEDLGVTVHTQKNTLEIVDGEEGTHRMQFADGSHLDADMIVFSAGIRPRDELARDCGLAVGARGGIVIDDSCRTSDPDIYAIGECALWGGLIFGLVAPGYEMARTAARHLLGEQSAVHRRRHEHQAQADGRRRGQLRRRARRRRRQPLLPVHRRAQAGLQEARRLRLRQVPARRRPGRRRRRLRHPAADDAEPDRAARVARIPDPAASATATPGRRSASTPCPTRPRSAPATTSPRARICAAVCGGAVTIGD